MIIMAFLKKIKMIILVTPHYPPNCKNRREEGRKKNQEVCLDRHKGHGTLDLRFYGWQ